jgi:hypothetical protein
MADTQQTLSRLKRREVRQASNEQIMSDCMSERGCAELRITFQTYDSKRQRWAGLRGKSILAKCENPGVLLEVVRLVRETLLNRSSRSAPSAN